MVNRISPLLLRSALITIILPVYVRSGHLGLVVLSCCCKFIWGGAVTTGSVLWAVVSWPLLLPVSQYLINNSYLLQRYHRNKWGQYAGTQQNILRAYYRHIVNIYHLSFTQFALFRPLKESNYMYTIWTIYVTRISGLYGPLKILAPAERLLASLTRMFA